MTFRAALWWGLFSVVCLTFVGAVKSRPVDGTDELCRIVKQGDCSCHCIQTRSTTWGSIADLYKRLFIKSFAPLDLESECRKCEAECKRHISVNCLNGVCHENGCECNACWKGKSCHQSANEHAPRFHQDSYKAHISDDVEPGALVAATVAVDDDKKKCIPDAPCPCGEIIYSITSGNEAGYFTIEKHSGNIRVAKKPESTTTFVLHVAAANIDGKYASTEISIDVVKSERRERRSVNHHIVRRSTPSPSPSGIITVTPNIPNNTFYNQGDKIIFNLTASHNQSIAVAQPTSSLNFKCSSKFLSVIDKAAISQSKSVDSWGVNNGELTFTAATLNKIEVLKIQFEAEVKTTIPPLANLYFSCEATTSSYKIGPSTSSPILYGVFPRITLARLTSPGVSLITVDTTLKFQMITDLPTLTFPLAHECTTAINDFSSMGIRNVQITKKGSNIGGGDLNPTPQYHKSSQDLNHYDRVTLDFKNLTVSSGLSENSKIEIEFDIDLNDHPLLANGSKLWIGCGLSSASSMLAVVQTAVYVKKIEPTVSCTVTPKNNTIQNRYSIDDRLVIDFECSHTNTSTANAKNINLEFWSVFLDFLSATYTVDSGSSKAATKFNDTRLDTITEVPFNQGQVIKGEIHVKVRHDMYPLAEMNLFVRVSYQNLAGKDKMKTVHKMKQPPIGSVPVISLNITNPKSCYHVGSTVEMDFKILMRKINSPLKVEIISPVNSSSPVMAIKSVSSPVVGSNIVNNGPLQKTPINCKSTVNDTSLNDRCSLDFGSVKSTVGIVDSPLNELSIKFNIILNDHQIMTNGSKHWQAVGVRGGSRMMWIGEVAIKVCSSAEPKPVLKIESNCYIPGTSETCCTGKLKKNDKVQFNITVSHDNITSEQYAKNIKVIHMLPRYVVYESTIFKHPSSFVFANSIVPQLTDSEPFRFLDQLTFSYIAKLDPEDLMKLEGNTQATSFADVSYVGHDTNKFFSTSTEVCASFTIPPGSSSGKPSLESSHVHGWYLRGLFLLLPTKTLIVCSENVASSSCFYTSDLGISWTAMNNQVGRVIANDGEVLYAIARNKRAYMKQKKRGDTWCSISEDQLKSEVTKLPSDNLKVIHGNETNEADPKNEHILEDGSHRYGGNKNAVYFRPKSGGSWQKMAIWKCCGAL